MAGRIYIYLHDPCCCVFVEMVVGEVVGGLSDLRIKILKISQKKNQFSGVEFCIRITSEVFCNTTMQANYHKPFNKSLLTQLDLSATYKIPDSSFDFHGDVCVLACVVKFLLCPGRRWGK